MKISKINAEVGTNPAETASNVDFKAIKLKRSSLKMSKPLQKDIFEMRKNLPDNKLAQEKKYFGNAEIGGTGGNNNYDEDDVVKMFAIWGAAIAAAALL